MLKSLAFVSLFAALPLANAQSVDSSTQPAPIVRRYQPNGAVQRRPHPQQDQIVESQPIPGVWLRSESTSALTTVSATPERTEIRLDHGRLNVTVHQPAQHSELLIDLPAGQTSLLKDGLYTFNADTNTIRVLHGEAATWPGTMNANASTKAIKIKEDHQLSVASLNGTKPSEIKSVEAYPYELTADLLPFGNRGDGGSDDYASDYPRYSPRYGDYPYYAGGWGYPGYSAGYFPGYYGYGYPYGYSIGIGYYGGFGGGYSHRGGFRR